ncbi:glycosyl hydrolase [uncultured Imperialibacter sp.]|uniref:glycoside hydrolase family 26 protein n=1 Tax=uncultured Imperialibacter sp. TaxID=1672639 RepID=UPI0030DB576A|tara:strand:+ start:59677 stop:61182 length:1506 start_codon:yes stop_codon:yes gene_type:complete
MRRALFSPTLLCLFNVAAFAQIAPVTPNASPEARALLEYIQSLSGKHTLVGQHNFPISRDRNSQFAADYIGKTPPVWSQDFGFAKDGDKDSYLARPSIVEEAIRQHQLGAIVTLCWHAVPPTADEPVTFQPLPGFDSMALASVQGDLLDKQFKDLLKKGTKINKKWLTQVDEIAGYLKQLQDAGVPVLWRPYHEMNGDWFWWGGRTDPKYGTAALYRQIFDRMVNYHKLNNLIWVWSVDRPSAPGREFIKYYPGNEYLDILSLDVYGRDFNQSYYDGLMELSQGKPLALGEVGNPPSLEILEKQPNWTYWVVWSGMVRGTPKSEYEPLVADSRIVFMEDKAYTEGTKGLRKAEGFEPLPSSVPADFTGEWVLNEDETKYQGFGGPAVKLSIVQKDNKLMVKSTSVVEWADDEVSEQTLPLDGSDIESKMFNSPRIQHANWSPMKDTLSIDSKVTFNFGGNSSTITGLDVWTLQRRGKKLVIQQASKSPRGENVSTVVYDKR